MTVVVRWWDFNTCVVIDKPCDASFWRRWRWQLYQDDGRPTMDNGYAWTYKRARKAARKAWKARL